jgi:hypothetical protein
MLLLRLIFAVAVTATAAGLLLAGLPLGAVAVVGLAVLLRRAADGGRFSDLRPRSS